jgi:hypothetical protein
MPIYHRKRINTLTNNVHLVCLFRGSSAIGLRSLHDLPLPLLRVKVHAQHLPKGLVRRAADQGELNNSWNTTEINFKRAEQGRRWGKDPDPHKRSSVVDPDLAGSTSRERRSGFGCSNTENYDHYDADERCGFKTNINFLGLVNIFRERE